MLSSVLTGNRCGHDKTFLREYRRPLKHKQPPPIILSGIDALSTAFYAPAKLLQRFHTLNINRRKKSERRESVIAVMQVLINYVDLDSLRVGTYDEGNINHCRTAFIAKKTGFGLRRVERALKDIEAAGYAEIERNVKQRRWVRGWFQVNKIKLTRWFFLDLGLSNQYLQVSQHFKRKSDIKQKNPKSYMRDTLETLSALGMRRLESAPPPLKTDPQKPAEVKLSEGSDVRCWADIVGSKCDLSLRQPFG